MLHTRLPAHALSLARLVGPAGWIAAGLIAGAFVARSYLRRLPAPRPSHDELAVSQWEGEGGLATAPDASR